MPNCWLASANPLFGVLVLVGACLFAPSERTSFKVPAGVNTERAAQVMGKTAKSVNSLQHRALASPYCDLGVDAA